MNNNISIEQFEAFNVYTIENAYSLFHIQINTVQFYKLLFDYFFEENKLIQYIKNQKGIDFKPTKEQYVTLYKHLQNYIDLENLSIILPPFTEQEINETLNEEMDIAVENDKFIIRLDKFGKIGEYLFSTILSNYFKFDCIIPKVHFTTDNNMSIYGIDTLFYSSEQNLLLFGESKFCVKLQNGINLINKSLKDYEQQISEEFRLVLSGGFKEQCSELFKAKFADARDVSLTIKDFIEKADIKKIGIPVFIAHGTELNNEEILLKLKTIDTPKLFNLDTIYYFISLPIISKNELMNTFIAEIKERVGDYSASAR